MKDTTSQGDVTEAQVIAALIRRGRKVLRPVSSAMRYDLAIDNEDGTYTRVQCKTGVLRKGCVVFRLYSISGHAGVPKHYGGQVDAFGVYCPQNRQTYLIPVSAIRDCRYFATLRVVASRNGQRSKTRPAEPFVLD